MPLCDKPHFEPNGMSLCCSNAKHMGGSGRSGSELPTSLLNKCNTGCLQGHCRPSPVSCRTNHSLCLLFNHSRAASSVAYGGNTFCRENCWQAFNLKYYVARSMVHFTSKTALMRGDITTTHNNNLHRNIEIVLIFPREIYSKFEFIRIPLS